MRLLEKLTAVGEMTAAMSQAATATEIYREALEAITRVTGSPRASVLLFDADGVLRFKAWRGLSEGYRAAVEGHTPWTPGQAAPEPILVPDVHLDPALCALKPAILTEGIQALAFIPLVVANQTIGKFMIYYAEPHAFDAEEVQLVRNVAAHTAFALDRLRVVAQLQAERNLFITGPTVLFEWVNTDRWPIHKVSPNVAELLGWSAAELEGKAFDDLLHPDDYARVRAETQGYTTRRATSFDQEYRLRHKNGEYRRVYDHTHLGPESGQARYVYGYLLDVTERLKAVEQLPIIQERLRLALAGAGLFSWEWDARRQVRRAARPDNPVDLDHGLEESITLEGFLARLHPDDQGPVGAAAQASIQSGEAFDLEYRLIEADGSLTWYHDRGRAFRDAEGELIGLAGIAQDITARKQAELAAGAAAERVHERQRLESLGVLAGGIAHDFNNLLMGVLGNASLALAELPPSSLAAGVVRDIETAARRAAELTRQLLAYSGRGSFVLQRLDLSRLVEETGQLLSAVISKRASVHYQLEPGLPAIEADQTQVRQVAMNLLTNASDALNDLGGTIHVRTTHLELDAEAAARPVQGGELHPGPYVTLIVRDSGAGMDAETVARMFDPFFTTKFQGRGLGLAAVLGIVRAHHGAIRVHSTPGAGTTVSVYFPAVGSEAPPVEVVPRTAGTASGTILVVDDEPIVRSVTERILARAGYDVLLAGDGLEALALLDAHRPQVSLVLLDLTMPELGGEETFERLRARWPDLPVVFSSGYSVEGALGDLLDRGVVGYIQKPYSLDDLLLAVRTTLEAPLPSA